MAGLLAPIVGHPAHHIRNLADFIQQIQTATVKDGFDVISLFTKVPLRDKFKVGILRLFTQ
jgi:hypothetical protein